MKKNNSFIPAETVDLNSPMTRQDLIEGTNKILRELREIRVLMQKNRLQIKPKSVPYDSER